MNPASALGDFLRYFPGWVLFILPQLLFYQTLAVLKRNFVGKIVAKSGQFYLWPVLVPLSGSLFCPEALQSPGFCLLASFFVCGFRVYPLVLADGDVRS